MKQQSLDCRDDLHKHLPEHEHFCFGPCWLFFPFQMTLEAATWVGPVFHQAGRLLLRTHTSPLSLSQLQFAWPGTSSLLISACLSISLSSPSGSCISLLLYPHRALTACVVTWAERTGPIPRIPCNILRIDCDVQLACSKHSGFTYLMNVSLNRNSFLYWLHWSKKR